jgi:hypothetical protein
MKNLFLDDIRNPIDAIGLVPIALNGFYFGDDWVIVRNYLDFCNHIERNGLPDFISFDHDLADEHYNDLFSDENWAKDNNDINLKYDDYREKTGYECAKWLVDWCLDNKYSLPNFIVHSQNPVGKKNIENYLNNAKKHLLNA